MLLECCKAKIHHAAVTEANLRYEGSITIDGSILKAAGILPFERVQVVNVNNGERFDTYVIAGRANSRVICLNGPAARLGQVGDRVIIIAYCLLEQDEAKRHQPRIVILDDRNRIKKRN